MDSDFTQSENPNLSNGLGPATCPPSALPHSSSCSFTVVSLVTSSTLPSPFCSPSVHSKVFSGLLPHSSQVSTQMLHLLRLPDYPAWNSNLHSPLILSPPSLPIPSASLFYCIATYYYRLAYIDFFLNYLYHLKRVYTERGDWAIGYICSIKTLKLLRN